MLILGVALFTGIILSCTMIAYIIEADIWFWIQNEIYLPV